MTTLHFTVRVVLHGVDSDESELYGFLHDTMENAGFVRTISISGVRYKLPPGEYSKLGDLNKIDVLNDAIRAANFVMPTLDDFSVFVTADPSPRAFHNLERAP